MNYILHRPADPPEGVSRAQELPDFARPRDDWEFYQQLPNVSEREEFQPQRGKSWSEWGTIITTGSALVTSTAFATIVKAWIASRRRKITISNRRTGKSLTYEGPSPSRMAGCLLLCPPQRAWQTCSKPTPASPEALALLARKSL